jgi:hypothetical protein
MVNMLVKLQDKKILRNDPERSRAGSPWSQVPKAGSAGLPPSHLGARELCPHRR